MSFNDLSNELVLEILELLREDFFEGTRSLHNLAASCRRLNTLATPVLYRIFRLPHSYTDESLHVLLKLITEKPNLRFQVREIDGVKRDCYGHCCLNDQSQDGFGDQIEEALETVSIHTEENLSQYRISMATITTSPDEMQAWTDSLLAGHWHAIFGVLLLSLPNLKRIKIHSPGSADTKYSDLVFRKAAEIQTLGQDSSFLKQLTSISMGDGDYDLENDWSLNKITSCLELKSLSKAWFQRVNDCNYRDQGYFESGVKDLTLQNSDIEGANLVKLLRNLPKLQRFEYTVGGGCSSDVTFYPQMIGKAMTHLKPSLEKLVLDSDDQLLYATDFGSIGFLTGFQMLHEIRIEAEALLGPRDENSEHYGDQGKIRLVDVLPKSLRILELIACGIEIVPQAQELVKRKKEIVPLLESMRLGYVYDHYDNEISRIQAHELFESLKEELKGDCKNAGVQLSQH